MTLNLTLIDFFNKMKIEVKINDRNNKPSMGDIINWKVGGFSIHSTNCLGNGGPKDIKARQNFESGVKLSGGGKFKTFKSNSIGKSLKGELLKFLFSCRDCIDDDLLINDTLSFEQFGVVGGIFYSNLHIYFICIHLLRLLVKV